MYRISLPRQLSSRGRRESVLESIRKDVIPVVLGKIFAGKLRNIYILKDFKNISSRQLI